VNHHWGKKRKEKNQTPILIFTEFTVLYLFCEAGTVIILYLQERKQRFRKTMYFAQSNPTEGIENKAQLGAFSLVGLPHP
jgi:hypothetical protein